MKMKKYLVILVVLLALFLRIFELGKYPTGLLWDEAALGYNAYSILKTGRDEYGQFLPLIFKSFGDHKPGFYIYLTIPSVAIFGLNELAVRLPSAVFGALSVLALYFLIKEALGGLAKKSALPLIAAILLAINPWHLNFSRGAWELNLMTFELLGGLLFLVQYLNYRQKRSLYFSGFFWLLALFTYQSAKALVPALLLGVALFFRAQLKAVALKPKIGFTAVFLAGFLFFNFLTATDGRSGRIKVMSVFSYPRSGEETQMIQAQDNGSKLAWSLFHGSPVFFLRGVAGRYLNYFSGKFLFFTGDWSNARNGVFYHGLFYFIDLVFLIWGLGVLFRKKRLPLENLMIYWLLLAPVPSALTRDIISSVRSFTLVIPLIFVISLGLEACFDWINRKGSWRFLGYLALGASYLLLFARFLDLYFVHDPVLNAEDRLWGYKEVVNYIEPLVGGKERVIFTTKYGQPYIFYLFYTQYDPARYQKQARLKENAQGDVGEVERIGKIEFRKIYWPDDRGIKNSLFVGDEFDLPTVDTVNQEGILALRDFRYPSGKVAFRVVKTD